MRKLISRLGPYGSAVAITVLVAILAVVAFAIIGWERDNRNEGACRHGVEETLKDSIRRTQHGQPPGGVEPPVPACMKLPQKTREDIYNDLVKQYFDDLLRANLTASPTP